MSERTPLASIELRWFFTGTLSEQPALRRWFETTPFFGPAPAAPVWHGRLGGQPDRYLVLPGAADLGIKWREGELQVKGRVGNRGLQQFEGGHVGRVEHWFKWSYAGLPAAWQSLFDAGRVPVVPVGKMRALRKFRLDSFFGDVTEVPVETRIDRGMGIELTEIAAGNGNWCSLAFEAFPDDTAMPDHFNRAVGGMLRSLRGWQLGAAESLSYPGWLARLTAPGGG